MNNIIFVLLLKTEEQWNIFHTFSYTEEVSCCYRYVHVCVCVSTRADILEHYDEHISHEVTYLGSQKNMTINIIKGLCLRRRKSPNIYCFHRIIPTDNIHWAFRQHPMCYTDSEAGLLYPPFWCSSHSVILTALEYMWNLWASSRRKDTAKAVGYKWLHVLYVTTLCKVLALIFLEYLFLLFGF